MADGGPGNNGSDPMADATFTPMSIEIRAITEDELDQYMAAIGTVFGEVRGEGEAERIAEVVGLDRTFAAFDGGRIVGTMGSYGLGLVVPGGADVAAAGLTRVTVAGTDRGRGILRAMMDVHFEDAAANDEPIGALWASEMQIYGRYGYGLASDNLAIKMDCRLARLAAPALPDQLIALDRTEAAETLPPVFDRVRGTRPGHLSRSGVWWTHRILADFEYMRHGAGPLVHVVASRDGEAVGYVLYRQKMTWDSDELPAGTVEVLELAAIDPRAEHTLWSHVSSLALYPNLSVWSQPIDSMVSSLAENERAVLRKTNDGLMVRLFDVCRALTTRRYDRPGQLVLRVEDGASTLRPIAGTYRLTVGDDGAATCEATDTEPEVTLASTALGAIYLGHATKGRLDGFQATGALLAPPDAVDRLRRLFAWPVAPWCNEIF